MSRINGIRSSASKSFGRLIIILRTVPVPLIIFGVVLFVYAFVNFMTFMSLMEGGSPVVINEAYYLNDHGRMIRELSPNEYHTFEKYEVRGFSGHWMIFSYIPSVFYAFKDELIEKMKSYKT